MSCALIGVGNSAPKRKATILAYEGRALTGDNKDENEAQFICSWRADLLNTPLLCDINSTA